MPLLLHQNMQRFGGTPSHVLAYEGRAPVAPPSWPNPAPVHGSYGFPRIRALAGAPFAVAGLTELTNNVAAARAALDVSQHLLGANPTAHLVNFGRMAGMPGPEHVAICVAAGVEVARLGRIALGPGGELVGDAHEAGTPPFPKPWMAQPPNGSLDYRAIVYAVVRFVPQGEPVGVAFFHNVYANAIARTFAMQQLAAALDAIQHDAALVRGDPGAPLPHVYLGGDFNVEPLDRGAYAAFAAVTDAQTPRPFGGGAIGGTTWGGNTYDYWHSDRPRVPGQLPRPSISAMTWDGPRGLMSDHVATILEVA